MSKKLVICADGTRKHREELPHTIVAFLFGRSLASIPSRPTNVLRLARAVRSRCKKTDTVQVVFYEEGVGLRGGYRDRAISGITGFGLINKIMNIYRFLANNYEPGDKIYLFGFSRGALTVRYLAALMEKIGLIEPRELHNLPLVISAFLRQSLFFVGYSAHMFFEGSAEARKILEDFAQQSDPESRQVHFVGLWDTVASLRWFAHRQNSELFTQPLGLNIRQAYQALAIDEQRWHFQPAIWTANAELDRKQILEQVWFPGSHSDVGGGNDNVALSIEPFLWVARKAESAGLSLDWAFINGDPRFHVDLKTEVTNSRTSFYRLFPRVERRIGAIHPETEGIHESAVKRMKVADLEYNPRNLIEALKSVAVV